MNAAIAAPAHPRVRAIPLRSMLLAWSSAVAVLIASGSAWSIAHGGGDWRVFVAAGSLAGRAALVDPPQAWQSFLYLPGAAWALVPFAHLPAAMSFLTNAVLMLACATAAGLIAARTYALGRAPAVATFALWAPVVYAAAIIGQNAPFGLLLAQLSIAGMATRSVALTAIPIGLLMYKPTYAAPFIALLVLRGRLRELLVVVAFAGGWYGLGVTATGGDWGWPAPWSRLIAEIAGGDFAVNAVFAVSLPGLLVRSGGLALAAAVTVLVALAAAVALRRAGPVEAGSAASLIGLALSPHAWAYDAVLALPMIGFTAGALREPDRSQFLLAVALAGPLFFVAPLLRFDPLAIVIGAGTLVWLALRLRASGSVVFAAKAL